MTHPDSPAEDEFCAAAGWSGRSMVTRDTVVSAAAAAVPSFEVGQMVAGPRVAVLVAKRGQAHPVDLGETELSGRVRPFFAADEIPP